MELFTTEDVIDMFDRVDEETINRTFEVFTDVEDFKNVFNRVFQIFAVLDELSKKANGIG